MQINTELSPIISPKSNLSISFVSPRDNVLVNFTSNRTNHTHSDKNSMDLHHSRHDNYNTRDAHDLSYRPTNETMTNESYSVDRVNQQDYSSRNNGYQIAQNDMMLIAENSTDRGHFYEDETSRSRVDNMNFIEFEEFVPNRCGEKKVVEEVPTDDTLESKRTARIRADEDFEEKIDLATINLKNRNVALKDPEVENNITAKKKYNISIGEEEIPRNFSKNKFDSCDLPLQDSRHSSNNLDIGPQTSKDSLRNDPFDNPEGSISNYNSKNDDLISSLKRENQDLKLLNMEQADLIEFLKSELERYKDRENDQLQQYHHHTEGLNKEIEKLRNEVVILTQNLKEAALEKLRFKEKSENQNDYITKIEEKYVHLETTNLKFEKELKKKDQENKALIEENKSLLDKKTKYKNNLKEKDQHINELRNQIDDFESIKHNELYVSVVEKNKIYKEKIGQLSKQIDDHKEILKSKENAIENLLTRMDELTDSLANKNNEIVALRDELTHSKKDVPTTKKNERSNSIHEKSGKAPNKEREILNMLNKQLEDIENRASVKDERKKSQGDVLSSAERPRQQENERKPVFQSYDFNERSRNTENVNVKGWESNKLRLTYNSEKYEDTYEEEFLENTYKKSAKNHKSVENEIKVKPSQEIRENRESQNLEDLQKKLAILKNKRMEFEKRKSASSVGRDEERSRERDEYLSTQPNLRTKPLQINHQNLTSPAGSEKKLNWDERVTHKREKENSIKVNNFTSENDFAQRDSLFKSNSGNHSTEEAIKDQRPSSKNKIKRPPKIDNYQGNTNFNKTDANLKSTLRNSSLSNTSSASTIKNETSYVKSHKKSLDSTSKIDHHKFYESPAKSHLNKERSVEKSGSKPKDVKDWIHRGAMTPSSSLQASIMEKIMEGKLRK